MTRFLTTLMLVAAMGPVAGCGNESTEAAASAEANAEQASAAAEPIAEPAAPAPSPNVGEFGAFMISANTIDVDGQCFEVGLDNPTDEQQQMMRQVLTRAAGGSEAAVTTDRCPAAGRLSANCTIRQLNGINYYYSTGPHAMTAESARSHCEENRGTLAE